MNSSTLNVFCSTFRDNQAIGGNDNSGFNDTGTGAGGARQRQPSWGTGVGEGKREYLRSQSGIGGTGIWLTSLPTIRLIYLLGPNLGGGGTIEIVKGSGEITGSTFGHNQAIGGQGAATSNGGSGAGAALPPSPSLLQLTSL